VYNELPELSCPQHHLEGVMGKAVHKEFLEEVLPTELNYLRAIILAQTLLITKLINQGCYGPSI
jgi:hypothetical protein